MHSKTLHCLSVAAFALMSSAASAQTIRVDYVGTITDLGSLLTGNGVAVNDKMTGSFTYDSNQPGLGLIAFSNSFANGFVASMAAGTGQLFVQNDQQNGAATLPADGFTVYSGSTSGAWNGYSNPVMQFGLRQDNILGQLWNDTALPDMADWSLITLAAINAPDWRWLDFGALGIPNFADDQIRWSVDSFRVTDVSAVPLPAAAWLFGSALLGLAGFTRRHRTPA